MAETDGTGGAFRTKLQKIDIEAALDWLKEQGASRAILAMARAAAEDLDDLDSWADLEASLAAISPSPQASVQIERLDIGSGNAVAPGGTAIQHLILNIFQASKIPDTLRQSELDSYLWQEARTDIAPVLTALDADERAQDTDGVKPLRLSAIYRERRAALRREPPRDQRKVRVPELRDTLESTLEIGALSEVRKKHRHLVVTAGPGMGKTWLLRHLSLQRLQEDPDQAGIPIIVSLRRFGPWLKRYPQPVDGSALWAYLAQVWEKQPFPSLADGLRDWLADDPGAASKKITILADGLDEVPIAGGLREKVTTVFEALADQTGASVILTSRSRSYAGFDLNWCLRHRRAKDSPAWPVAELLPFEPDDIDAFADSWFRELVNADRMPTDEGEQLASSFKETLHCPARLDLARLAKVPLNTTAMCLIHWRDKELPPGRAVLFERLFKLLLGRWEDARAKHTVERRKSTDAELESTSFREILAEPGQRKDGAVVLEKDLMRELGRLLFDLTFEFSRGARTKDDTEGKGGTIDIPEARLHQLFCGLYDRTRKADDTFPPEARNWADRLLGFIRENGGLLDPALGTEGEFSFPHRQYGEFLAGWWLLEHAPDTEEGDLVKRLADGLCRDVADWDDVWREPILLAVDYLICDGKPERIERMCRSLTGADLDHTEHYRLIMAAEILAGHGDEGFYKISGWWSAVRDALERRLIGENDDVHQRDRSGSALALMGDTRFGVGVITLGGITVPDFTWIKVAPPASGRFTMGSDGSGWDAEQPEFSCTFLGEHSGFSMAAYPVTVGQMEAFVRAGGYEPGGQSWWTEAGWQWKTENGISAPECVAYGMAFSRANVPVTGVSFYEAVAFCRWLRAMGEQFGNEQLKGARLPAEWEWEWAARGDDDRKEGRKYPWGDQEDLIRRCNSDENQLQHVTAVGMLPLGNSWCGVSDLAGNVWEWTATPWQENLDGFQRLYDEESDERRSLRGGSWRYDRSDVRASDRLRFHPGFRDYYVGFRVVSSPFFPSAERRSADL
ncbi:MAG: SUMF1/EgtB/PvdO family nonheme iron enzyme [Verrucomicrobiales bacterium]